MPRLRVAITIERNLLNDLDELVAARAYSSRSHAIEAAVTEMLARRPRTRLAAECKRLDPAEERARAEEGMSAEMRTWPKY